VSLRHIARALLVLPCILFAGSARAQDPTLLTGTAAPRPRPVVPGELRWDAPDVLGFWALAEVQNNPADAGKHLGSASGGLRFAWSPCGDESLLDCGGLRFATRPQFSSVPGTAISEGGRGPELALSFAQEAELDLRPGLTLRTGTEIGSRIGFGARPEDDADGAVAKARAGATVDLRALGTGLPVRLGVTLAVARDLHAPPGERHDGCEGALEISVAGYAPLRVTSPCTPDARDTWIGFGLRRRF
jgi:hypothetical protein